MRFDSGKGPEHLVNVLCAFAAHNKDVGCEPFVHTRVPWHTYCCFAVDILKSLPLCAPCYYFS